MRATFFYCSFCGKSQHETHKLITSPSVYICDECIDLCNKIIRNKMQGEAPGTPSSELPIPSEIAAILDQYVIGQQKAKRTLAVASGGRHPDRRGMGHQPAAASLVAGVLKYAMAGRLTTKDCP